MVISLENFKIKIYEFIRPEFTELYIYIYLCPTYENRTSLLKPSKETWFRKPLRYKTIIGKYIYGATINMLRIQNLAQV